MTKYQSRWGVFWTVGLAVTAVACGGDDGDGNTAVDASFLIDATPLPDADPNNLTVRVLGGSEPIAGADVILHDSSGAVTAEFLTSAEGEVRMMVAGGEMVSVVLTDVPIATTWMSVQPGDELVVRLPFDGDAVTTADVTLPVAVADATRYRVFAGSCSSQVLSTENVVSFGVDPVCLNPDGTVSIAAFAINDQGVHLATTYINSVAIVSGGSTAVTLGAFNASDMSDWTLTAANPSATATLDGVDVKLRAGGFVYPLSASVSSETSATVPRDAVFSEYTGYEFNFTRPGGSSVSNDTFIVGQVAAADNATSVDISARMMQPATAISRDDTVPLRPVFNIAYAAAPTTDGVLHVFEGGGGVTRGEVAGFQWSVVTDNASVATVPALPARLTQFQEPITNMQTLTVRSDFWADYDAAKSDLANLFFANSPLPNSVSTIEANLARLERAPSLSGNRPAKQKHAQAKWMR